MLEGDCRDLLRTLPDASIHACVTSPPYFGLRDYGTSEWEDGDPSCEHTFRADGGTTSQRARRAHQQGHPHRDCSCGARRVDRQIGLESTPDEFVAALVDVFREVRRVLRDDGTVWLNLGDSYARRWSSRREDGARAGLGPGEDRARRHAPPDGFKSKDLIGIPWLVAFALRADGWYLRSDVIWAKPNPMPESVADRPTKAHEYLFLFSKRPKYFYDADAIREPHIYGGERSGNGAWPQDEAGRPGADGAQHLYGHELGRNKRSVWTVATQPYAGAHFATFPPALIAPCILAGAPEGGTVLDPFAGAGTSGMVALRHSRSFIGIELNPAFAALARTRIVDDAPLLNMFAEDAA